MTETPDPRPVRLIPCWIALAVLFVFASLARCGFTEWDDPSTLARNPYFNPPAWASVAHYWSHPHMGLYVPVTYTVWAGIAHFAQGGLPNGVGSQLRPGPFHLANLFLHLTSACLVYAILRRLVAKPWPAAAGALLFALHPVQVEAVAWASGLKDLLCGSFCLLAILNYLSYATPQAHGACSVGSRRRVRFAVFATIAFLAATLSKPTAITLPLIALALDRWMLERPWRRAVRLPAVWLACAIPVALVTGRVQEIGTIPYVAPLNRLLVAGDALAFYLRHLAWPAALAVDYARRPSVVLGGGGGGGGGGAVWLACLLPLAAAAVLVHQRWRRPWLLAAAAVFLAPLLPVLGLRPFMMQYTSTVADHYLYLPMLGLACAAATYLARYPGPRATAACLLLLAAMAWRSASQTRYWTDDQTLNRHTLAVTPQSFTAHMNLAHDLELQGDFQGELVEDAAAVRANPDFPLARGNYAVMLATLGHVDQAAAQCDALRRLIVPLPPQGQQTFAPTFAFVGRELIWHHEPARAVEFLQQAITLDPDGADARADLRQAQASLDPQN